MKLLPIAYVMTAATMLCAADVWAQTSATGPSFTAAQAAHGQQLYFANCAMCHGANLDGMYGPALNGPDSNIQWQTVKDVYGYMTVQMPVGNAGGLPAGQYADIMAFILKAHGHQPGKTPLTPTVAQTSSIFVGPQ